MAHVDNKHRRRGNALVSAAMMFPLLLFITFGMLEFGWLYVKKQQITNAARSGARVGARADAISTDIDAAVAAIMSQAGITGYTVTITPLDVTTLARGQILTVKVEVSYNDSNELLDIGEGASPPPAPPPPEGEAPEAPNYFPLPLPDTIQATVSMAREGP